MKASNSQIFLVMSIFHCINLPAGFLSVSQAYLYQLPLLQRRSQQTRHLRRRSTAARLLRSCICCTLMCICCTLCVFVLLLMCICCTLCVFVVLCVYCCSYFRCRTAGQKSVSCDQPPRHRFFFVSLCLQANAEMVPKFPSCYYMPLIQPSRLKFHSYFFFLSIFLYM